MDSSNSNIKQINTSEIVKRSALFILVGIIICGIVGSFISGASGRNLGGGIGAGLGLYIGWLRNRQK